MAKAETRFEAIIHDFGPSRVVSRGLDLIVQIKSGDGWQDVRSFNRVSDDLPFISARDEAGRLASAQRRVEQPQ